MPTICRVPQFRIAATVKRVTTRNSRNLVDVFLPEHPAILLHGDGEFSTATTLVESTLTGRDFGWLPDEQSKAVHHIANVIREDNGQDVLGQQYGGSYAKLMLGTARDLPDQFRLANDFRIDVTTRHAMNKFSTKLPA